MLAIARKRRSLLQFAREFALSDEAQPDIVAWL
jgi:hypothetical protein